MRGLFLVLLTAATLLSCSTPGFADPVEKFVQTLVPGDMFDITKPYCRQEDWLRGFLSLEGHMGDSTARFLNREWGPNACTLVEKEDAPPTSVGFTFDKYLSPPFRLRDDTLWIIEGTVVEGNAKVAVFTYLALSDILYLNGRVIHAGTSASAAKN